MYEKMYMFIMYMYIVYACVYCICVCTCLLYVIYTVQYRNRFYKSYSENLYHKKLFFCYIITTKVNFLKNYDTQIRRKLKKMPFIFYETAIYMQIRIEEELKFCRKIMSQNLINRLFAKKKWKIEMRSASGERQ